jgi:hypothetical protein
MVLRLLVLASLAILLLAPQVAAGGVRQKPFVITRVGLGPHGFVALQNGASITASLGGVSICQGRQCYVLPRVRVAPHRTVLIARDGGRGLKHVVARNARFGSLRPHDGEIALFSSRRIHKARTLFAYLQWGSTPHRLTKMAIAAGHWLKGSYAPSARDATLLYRNHAGLWLFKTR